MRAPGADASPEPGEWAEPGEWPEPGAGTEPGAGAAADAGASHAGASHAGASHAGASHAGGEPRGEADGPAGPAGGAAGGSAASPELRALRSAIAELDRRLIELLAERVRLAQRVGAAKRAAGLPTLDPAREAAVVRRAGALAREHGLEAEAVRGIFWHLIGLSRRAQTEDGA